MLDVSRDEIVGGSLLRALVVLAAPLIAQNLVHVANQVVDIFWLGRLGESAVAAVGLNYPVIALLFAFGATAPYIGTQVVVSQRVGADDQQGARRIGFHGLTLALVLGAVVCALGYLLSGYVFDLIAGDPTVAELATLYLATAAFGVPFVAMSDTLEGGFIGWGDARAALYINLVMVGTNVVLDPFLIFGWGPFPAFGVQGAAMASVSGYAAGFVLAFSLAVGLRDSFGIGRDAVGFELDRYREILDVGWPTAAQRVATGSGRFAIYSLVALIGGVAGVAAFTIGARVASIAYVPVQGLQQAAQSVVGQNLGAAKPDRAGRTTWIGVALAAGTLSVIGAVQWVIPETLALVFVPDASGAALGLTVDYLRILALGYWAIGASYLLRGGFNGARRTRTSLAASLGQYWIVRLPIVAVGGLVLGYGVHVAFWAVTISNVLTAVGLGGYFYYEASNGMLDRAAETAEAAAGD